MISSSRLLGAIYRLFWLGASSRVASSGPSRLSSEASAATTLRAFLTAIIIASSASTRTSASWKRPAIARFRKGRRRVD